MTAAARPSGREFCLGCVVPAYNEAALIGDFLPALAEALGTLAAEVKIMVVDDGSRDATGEIVRSLSGSLPLRYLGLSRNFGKEAALQAGLDHCDADCVLLIDADFQHPLAVIGAMVERWRDGVDMVYAIKSHREAESRRKRWGTRVFYKIVSGQRGVDIPPDAGDFRLLDRRVVLALRALPERSRFMKGLYAWVGFRSEGLRVDMPPRPAGESKFDTRGLARLAATGVTAFSVKPLRMVMLVGLLVSLVSMLMAGWIVFERLFLGQDIPGFATLGAAIFFLAGVQLVGLGIVGEYVGRIFEEVKQRPRYLVAEDSGDPR
ncbi:MAG: hypothetical protein RL026_2411 [Pseudomonadota bacterium]|jgi:glycosyltransferase involved in cell wall biosynthesis